MDEYKLLKKYYKKKNNCESNDFHSKLLFSIINKTLISILLFLFCLCGMKLNNNFKNFIRENVYNKNISFAIINDYYKKIFGNPSKIVEDVFDYGNNNDIDMVFSEKLVYKEKIDYKDGIKLIVNSNYLIPIQESGIIVYLGNKDGYGNTVIIQQINGVDMWYVGVNNLNVKLYDYVEKGNILGEVENNELLILYQVDGKFVDYKKYFE